MGCELFPVFELEQLGPTLFDGHGQDESIFFGPSGDFWSKVLIDEHTGPALGHPISDGLSSPLVNDQLCIPQFFQFRVVSFLGRPEKRLGKGVPMIHGEQEQWRLGGRAESTSGRGHGDPAHTESTNSTVIRRPSASARSWRVSTPSFS
jgi:hypothetical protein